MKPKKLANKLTLSKTTVSNLDNGDMNGVKGGFTDDCSLPASNCKTNCEPICRTQEITVCYCPYTEDSPHCLPTEDHWLCTLPQYGC